MRIDIQADCKHVLVAPGDRSELSVTLEGVFVSDIFEEVVDAVGLPDIIKHFGEEVVLRHLNASKND